MYESGVVATIVTKDGKSIVEPSRIGRGGASENHTFSDTDVKIPFGTEYGIFLKNTTPKYVLVKHITIDGKERLTNIVLSPYQKCTIKGALKDGDETNWFKFIEATDKIKEYLGTGAEIGKVRIAFSLETESAKTIRELQSEVDKLKKEVERQKTPTWFPQYWVNYAYGSSPNNSSGVEVSYTDTVKVKDIMFPDNGITVKGTPTTQKWVEVDSFETEDVEREMIFILSPSDSVTTTRDKLVCEFCGTRNSPTANYCSHCGSHL